MIRKEEDNGKEKKTADRGNQQTAQFFHRIYHQSRIDEVAAVESAGNIEKHDHQYDGPSFQRNGHFIFCSAEPVGVKSPENRQRHRNDIGKKQ